MKAYYDQKPVKLTDEFVTAIERLIEAELDMMQQHEPEMADCWTWGACYVDDLARSRGLFFQFGGDEDKPDWVHGRAQVLTKDEVAW
jgi:hypothetical protein